MPKKILLAPGEVKILKVLKEGSKMKSYTNLKDETKLSDPVLSDYLKRLQKKKFVKRDIDTRKYCLTVKGKRKLEFQILAEELYHILLECGETKPVKYENKTKRAFPKKKAEETKKNLEIVFNCEWILRKSLLEMFPKIKKLFGTDFFLKTFETKSGEIFVQFLKT